MNTLAKQQDYISEIITLINMGVECWFKAGKMIADNIDKNPDFVDQICDRCKDLSHETVHRFEQIGRQQLFPQLLLNDSPGVRRLRRLPFELQKMHYTKPVSVCLEGGETLEIDVRNLMPNQAAQVFSNNHVRSIAEQRAWLEEKRAVDEVVMVANEAPYRIVGRSVVVTKACRLSPSDLAKLLAQIEDKNG